MLVDTISRQTSRCFRVELVNGGEYIGFETLTETMINELNVKAEKEANFSIDSVTFSLSLKLSNLT